MKKSLILVGGGGHCRSCIDVIETSNCWEIAGILDKPHMKGASVCAHAVIGTDDDIQKYVAQGMPTFLVTVGQVKNDSIRRRLYDFIRRSNGTLPIVQAASSHISRHARVGDGSIVMHNAFVNAGACIGVNAIINTAALVEHDAIVGDHCHISTNAICNGEARIGNGCFLGSHSVVSEGIKICDECVIGAGSVVIRDIEEPGVYVGNPARRVG